MVGLTSTDFGDVIATQMRANHQVIAERWLDRLVVLLPVDAADVFPSHQLLDHIPALICELADFLRAPEEAAIAANTAVVAKATELGQLRHSQRASVHQLLREYQLLGGILAAFVQDETARLALSPSPFEAMALFTRLHDAVAVLQQSTVDTFVAAYTDTIARQTDRLGSFNRLVSHELRQPLAALQAAAAVLKSRQPVDSPPGIARAVAVVDRNVERLVELTRRLEAVSRLREDADTAAVQQIDIGTVAADVARQLREMADARGVTIRIDPALGATVLDLARFELVLMNLVSNAIKYADQDKPDRFVHIRAAAAGADTIAIAVADNGIGIDRVHMATLFTRFVRGDQSQDPELGTGGLGLGLSIVKECVDALGGTIDVESAKGKGTIFRVSVPVRTR